MLTPHGWVEMGDIKVGDHVTGPDGKPREVLGVYPQGEKDIYRLTFASGVTVECTEDHYWQVSNAYDRKRGTSRLMTLQQILKAGVRYPSGTAKWAVPLPDPVEFADPAPLPVDPYLLGLLIGDGCFRSNGKGSGTVKLAVADSDIEDTQRLITPMLPPGVSIRIAPGQGCVSFYFSRHNGGPRENPLTGAIRSLGLFDVAGPNKTIPAAYMTALVSDRIAMLQGLIDSDGHIFKDQSGVRFDTASRALAEQVADLARSLGGTGSVKAESRNGKGAWLDRWTVTIGMLPEWIVPARLSRKRAAYRPNSRISDRVLTLKSVELVRRAEAQCIKVDAEDGLYVTDGYVVTHNTVNLAVVAKDNLDPAQFNEWVDSMERAHSGVRNAYKTLYLSAGADPVPIGSTMEQMDFATTQGAGEVRIANAAGIHPVVIGLVTSLGGSSLNAGNYGAAKRSTVDRTFRPLWRNVCGSLQAILRPPPGGQARLWADVSDIAFLRDDEKDLAEIHAKEAQTVRTLLDAGFDAESVKAAVIAGDWSLLHHTGWFSVQLQKPGGPDQPAGKPPAPPAPAAKWEIPSWLNGHSHALESS